MLRPEQNERLTRVGRGTPAGELLRRYWHPIAADSDLDGRPTKRVRLLGEDLVLYRDRAGTLGLVEEACPHRGVSLAYGIPQDEGIRCPYHGWVFNEVGRCLAQPAEPASSSYADRVKAVAYPVQSLGGLIFAYLGPQPAPLLPRFDLFVQPGGLRSIGRAVLPCNWLQIMENGVDPVHFEWLHGVYFEYVMDQQRPDVPNFVKGTNLARHHIKIGFEPFEWGIIKRRVLEGQTEEDEDWSVGHPLVFPCMVRGGNARQATFQIRVPVDDETTYHCWYAVENPADGRPLDNADSIPVFDVPVIERDGTFIVDFLDGQDVMCWVSQGAVADRSKEHLGTSDQGIILLRKMLREQIRRVELNEDPIGVVRDPAKNQCIELPTERNKAHRQLDKTYVDRSAIYFSRHNPQLAQFGRLLEPSDGPADQGVDASPATASASSATVQSP